MADFNGLKEKALSALGTILDKSTEVYGIAEEKAKYVAKTTKLKADIAKDRTEQKKLYTSLGSMYYSLHKDSPEDGLMQICEELKVLASKIEAKQQELEKLAEEAAEPDIEINIDEEAPEEEAKAEENTAEDAKCGCEDSSEGEDKCECADSADTKDTSGDVE